VKCQIEKQRNEVARKRKNSKSMKKKVKKSMFEPFSVSKSRDAFKLLGSIVE